MEKFKPLLESTQCTNKSLALDFKNERSYQYGQRIWEWVNDADDRTFVVVAGHGHYGIEIDCLSSFLMCSSMTRRVPSM
jgi:hypothetical protein